MIFATRRESQVDCKANHGIDVLDRQHRRRDVHIDNQHIVPATAPMNPRQPAAADALLFRGWQLDRRIPSRSESRTRLGDTHRFLFGDQQA